MEQEKDIVASIQDMLKKINMTVRSVMTEEFSQYKLTYHQLYILRVIKQNSQINYTDLGNELKLAKSSISLTINKLIEEGYVLVKECQKDRRIKYLCLTDMGEKSLMEVKEHSRNVFSNLVEPLTIEELKQIEIQLTKLKITIDQKIEGRKVGCKNE